MVGLLRPRDGELVARARSGSRDAIELLARRHLTGAWRAAFAVSGSREVAEDCAQDAFLDALHALERFDQSRPFGPWIAKMAVNRALQVHRRSSRVEVLNEADLPDESAADELISALGDDDLARRLAELPAAQRAVLVLRYWVGLSPPEIADTLEVPVGTVHSREKRALDTLRGQIGTTP
jgi:RNA polymerase sigma-70 factor (ECF subfamily)